MKSILLDSGDRWTVLDRLTRSSRFASRIAPAAFSVTLGQSGFRMNVGQVEALTFFDATIRVLLAATKADSHLASLPITSTQYKSIRKPQCVFTGTVAEYRAAKDLIDPLHENYIRDAATTANGSPRHGHACAVRKCALRDFLRASHIKPWKHSTQKERLDPANGLLLSANIDILFDKGFVSFNDSGLMLISSRLSKTEKRALGLSGRLRRKPDEQQRLYLAQHRKAFGFPG